MLVTIDVAALYTNIPQEEGLDAVREALTNRDDTKVPTEFLIRMLEIVLKHNLFEFNSELFVQLIRTAMGSRPAPSYANLFMANKIDTKIVELANRLENETDPIHFFKRFLDDIFLIYTGTIESLHLFLSELNNLHPTIKFTMSHTIPPNMGNPTKAFPFWTLHAKLLMEKLFWTSTEKKQTETNTC